MYVHHFELDFRGAQGFARFPFMFDGVPVDGVSCAISHRGSGDMGYVERSEDPDRLRFFASLGIDPGRVYARSQIHSRDVAVAGEDDGRSGDGLVSNDPALILSVTVADCLPVFLFDTEHGALAVLHSGWKGTGIVSEALSLMARRWGTRAAAVAAVLGPCIRSCCYEVDAGRAAAFEAEFGFPDPAAGAFPLGPVVRRETERSYIDLQAANARLLRDAGATNLSVCRNCTYTDERLGSFRREGAGRFTRMVAVAGRLPEEKS